MDVVESSIGVGNGKRVVSVDWSGGAVGISTFQAITAIFCSLYTAYFTSCDRIRSIYPCLSMHHSH
jgi:hypothetical protein